jgi:hypothetical protein
LNFVGDATSCRHSYAVFYGFIFGDRVGLFFSDDYVLGLDSQPKPGVPGDSMIGWGIGELWFPAANL